MKVEKNNVIDLTPYPHEKHDIQPSAFIIENGNRILVAQVLNLLSGSNATAMHSDLTTLIDYYSQKEP